MMHSFAYESNVFANKSNVFLFIANQVNWQVYVYACTETGHSKPLMLLRKLFKILHNILIAFVKGNRITYVTKLVNSHGSEFLTTITIV